MNDDLRGRLEGHADWLEESGESEVQSHVSPDRLKQIAQDIRDSLCEDATEATPEAVSELPMHGRSAAEVHEWIIAERDRINQRQTKIECIPTVYDYRDVTWQTVGGSKSIEWFVFPPEGPATKIEYVPPPQCIYGDVDHPKCTGDNADCPACGTKQQ